MLDYKVDILKYQRSEDGSIMGKVRDYKESLTLHEQNKLSLIKRPPLSSGCDRTVTYQDFYSGKTVSALMFGSNSYLGTFVHKEAIQKAMDVTASFGIGAGGVPLLSGTNIYQNELEKTIAKVKGFDDTILFSSGFTANIGAIIGLVRPNNLIIHDKLNHASLLDGSLMSCAKMARYKHNDPIDLEKVLSQNHKDYPNGILVITDGVFSMDGDIANLPEIINVVNKYNAILLIDDAHATGVIGHKGKGTLSHFNIEQRDNIVVTGTLSKAIGAVGGFITASKEIIDYLRVYARSNMYSTALPPSVCASSTEMFKIIESTDIVDKLKYNSDYMRESLKEKGFNTLKSQTAIIPLIIKDEYLLTTISKDILDKGIIVNYIYPPAVQPTKARLRISVMATHTKEDMDYFVSVLEEVDKKYNIR